MYSASSTARYAEVGKLCKQVMFPNIGEASDPSDEFKFSCQHDTGKNSRARNVSPWLKVTNFCESHCNMSCAKVRTTWIAMKKTAKRALAAELDAIAEGLPKPS